MHLLNSVAFAYDSREDRILAAVNPGDPQTWACWLTRRLALAVLAQTQKFLDSTCAMAQQTTAEFRREVIAFERDAAIAATAKAIKRAPAKIVRTIASTAELAERLTISRRADKFQIELHGEKGGAAA